LKQLGYTGMHLIHPSHVPVVNQVFTPTGEEIAHWRGLVKAMEERRRQGGAAVTYGGDMVDVAHEETARPCWQWSGSGAFWKLRPPTHSTIFDCYNIGQ
jgi:citrate lyase beta subunit